MGVIACDKNLGHTTHLLGTLSRGENLIKDPFVVTLPINYEEPNIRGDVHLNVLGLTAINILI